MDLSHEQIYFPSCQDISRQSLESRLEKSLNIQRMDVINFERKARDSFGDPAGAELFRISKEIGGVRILSPSGTAGEDDIDAEGFLDQNCRCVLKVCV